MDCRAGTTMVTVRRTSTVRQTRASESQADTQAAGRHQILSRHPKFEQDSLLDIAPISEQIFRVLLCNLFALSGLPPQAVDLERFLGGSGELPARTHASPAV